MLKNVKILGFFNLSNEEFLIIGFVTLTYIMTLETSKTSPGRKTMLRRIFLYSSVMVQDLVLQSILIQWLVTVGIMIKMGKIQQAKIMNLELRRVKMESVWSGK